MTRRQKSLAIGIGIFMLLVILSMIAKAQPWPLESVSGYGYKKETRTKGVISLDDSAIYIRTNYETNIYSIRKAFRDRGKLIYDLETMSFRATVTVTTSRMTLNGVDFEYGTITLNKRYRSKPEQNIRYKYKKAL
jgi:hypothetical protein